MSGNGHGPDPCAKGHKKKTMFTEKRPDGSTLVHWICERCLTPGSDPA